MNGVGAVVSEVYAAGANLKVLDGGLAVGGEIPNELKQRVRAHRNELLEALVGDPLEGFGWEARTALYRQALRWLDGEVEKVGPKGAPGARAAIDALCRQDVADPLNAAWCDGNFERSPRIRKGRRARRQGQSSG